MKKLSAIAAVIIASSVLSSSCEREEPKPVDTAGKGGSASIIAMPQHHSRYIDSCTIYIKYNTNDRPNPVFNASQYDDAIKCTSVNGKPTATFTGLKKGKYFLYGYGYDTTIRRTVEAGKPVTITVDQSYEVIVPVTEGD